MVVFLRGGIDVYVGVGIDVCTGQAYTCIRTNIQTTTDPYIQATHQYTNSTLFLMCPPFAHHHNNIQTTYPPPQHHSSRQALRDPTTRSHVLKQVEHVDLMRFGLIPEFVGRFPVISSLQALGQHELVQVLTQPKSALYKQYRQQFLMNGAELIITEGALSGIASIAYKNATGARGLRAILERKLMDAMYEVPDGLYQYVLLDAHAVDNPGGNPHLFRSRMDLMAFLNARVDDADASALLERLGGEGGEGEEGEEELKVVHE